MTTRHFINGTVPLRRGLVADPAGKHYRRMRQAVWLYLYLLLAVNRATGQRLLSPAAVGREMGISEATVRSWLGHLRRAGYVTVRREAGLVRVGITRWQKTIQRSEAPEAVSGDPDRGLTRLSLEMLAKSLECGPSEPFLKEVISRHGPRQVREILDEVVEVPKSRIKKSRLALFRYLINKRLRP